MVTTRSTRSSTKHQAAKTGDEAPAKKRKTSKTTKKDIQDDKSGEKSGTKVSKVENGQKTGTQAKNKKQENGKGKPPADEPAAAEAEKKTTGGATRESKDSG
jgi:hypothetical protein